MWKMWLFFGDEKPGDKENTTECVQPGGMTDGLKIAVQKFRFYLFLQQENRAAELSLQSQCKKALADIVRKGKTLGKPGRELPDKRMPGLTHQMCSGQNTAEKIVAAWCQADAKTNKFT